MDSGRAIALHPGNIDTDLFRGIKESLPWLKPIFPALDWLISKSLLTPLQGSLTPALRRTSPEVDTKGLNGAYLEPIAKLSHAAKHANRRGGRRARSPDDRICQILRKVQCRCGHRRAHPTGFGKVARPRRPHPCLSLLDGAPLHPTAIDQRRDCLPVSSCCRQRLCNPQPSISAKESVDPLCLHAAGWQAAPISGN